MNASDSQIRFLCGFCEHVISAPASDEGRAGRCPRCQQVIVVPTMPTQPECSFPLDIDASERPMHQTRGLFHGVAVSLVVHTLLLSGLAIVYMKSRELGRAISVTLFLDSEGTEIEMADLALEAPAPLPATMEGDLQFANEAMSSSLDMGTMSPAGNGKRRENRLGSSAETTGSIDPAARFSPTVTRRLAQQPAARQGDYEVALYWDGISDLDLHVRYESNSGRVLRTINYAAKGAPDTGFLDVDQNYKPPFVDDPIEHVRWNTQSPPAGTYLICVHGYRVRSEKAAEPAKVPFTVEIKTPDGIRTFTGAVAPGMFVDAHVIVIGGMEPEAVEQVVRTEPQANQLLSAAKVKLARNDRTSKLTGTGMLRTIIRKFPLTEAANEARSLLQQQSN